MLNVMIADDQELIRESLKVVLDMNADMQVSGLAENGQELVELIRQHVPDVVLMDVRMPELDGVEATKVVKTHWPQVKIIILTTFDDDEYVYKALKYGASGYLLKGVSVQELSDAVRKVASGGSMLNPQVVNKVVKLFSQMAQSNMSLATEPEGAEELSRTERRVAHYVGCGFSNKEIAAQLRLSDGTVRNSLSASLAKLGLRDRTQLAIWAVQTGLAAQEMEP